MQTPRMGFKMTHLGGMPAVIGGYNTDLLKETEMFDGTQWVAHPTGMINDR